MPIVQQKQQQSSISLNDILLCIAFAVLLYRFVRCAEEDWLAQSVSEAGCHVNRRQFPLCR